MGPPTFKMSAAAAAAAAPHPQPLQASAFDPPDVADVDPNEFGEYKKAWTYADLEATRRAYASQPQNARLCGSTNSPTWCSASSSTGMATFGPGQDSER